MASAVRTVPGVKTVPRGLAVLLCLALCGLPCTTLRAAEPPAAASGLRRVSLQLPWTHRMQFAGFYMAKELGYYREAGALLDRLPFGGREDKDAKNESAEKTTRKSM